ncbi:hypothetical protein Hanom_Chr12g01075521 [Helianthus anomalus]
MKYSTQITQNRKKKVAKILQHYLFLVLFMVLLCSLPHNAVFFFGFPQSLRY